MRGCHTKSGPVTEILVRQKFGPGPILSFKILVLRTNFFEKSGPGLKILFRVLFSLPGDNAKLRIA